LPDSGNNFATLRLLMSDLITEKQQFDQAINEPDHKVRAQRLVPFLQPGINWCYFNRSLEDLSGLGPLGVTLLQHEAEQPAQQPRRCEILQALGKSKEPSAVPYLLSLAQSLHAQFTQVEGLFLRSQVSESMRDQFNTWQSTIYALAAIGDKRALPVLRDAAIWGAQHGDQQCVEYAVRGLAAAPSPDNLPCFTSVFSALPRTTDGFGRFAAYSTLLALIEHKYVQAVPLFSSQLDHPDAYNCRQAHRGLVELVGRDLGKQAEPWMQWYENMKMNASEPSR
jgi:HEAT repeat protein